MSVTRLSTKGQLIIPKDIRDRLGWAAGSGLAIEERGDSIVIRSAIGVSRTKLADVLGCLRHAGQPKTLEEMEAAIAIGAASRK